jgi:hypothetical protein
MDRVSVLMFFLWDKVRWLKTASHVSTLTIQAVFGVPGWVNDQ